MDQKRATAGQKRNELGIVVTEKKDGVAAGGHAVVETSAPLLSPTQVVRRFRRGRWTLTTLAL